MADVTPFKDDATPSWAPGGHDIVRPAIGKRYQILKVLKSTHFVTTYSAVNLRNSQKVILKALSRRNAPPLFEQRLYQEASLVQKIHSPSAITPLQIESDSDWFYVVFPFVEGVSLRTEINRAPIAWERVTQIGIQLLSSLIHAHEQGILHRDIKPENIILEDQEGFLKTTLIDFGSSWHESFGSSQLSTLGGSVAYMSPEQAGITSHPLDLRSDLYSIGVVLFECLTGRPPFNAENIGHLLRAHLNSSPPDIRTLRPQTPKTLCEIVYHCLEKDPHHRYQTAQAIHEDLRFFQKHAHEEKTFIAGFTDKRLTLAPPRFVGRERELEGFSELLSELAHGRGGISFVEAGSGEGKTRLLSEFSKSLDRNRYRVFFGQGVDQVARLPYQILTGLTQGVLTEAQADPQYRRSLQLCLESRKETLLSLQPAFRDLFPEVKSLAIGPEHFGEQRSLEALSLLLESLGTREKPALLILDDVQWADEVSLKLFRYWQTQKVDKRHLLILLAFRSEEVGAMHPIRALSPKHPICLKPLEKTEVSQLAQTMAGALPESVLDLVYQLSQGSPFMTAAVLRGLVETETLVPSGEGWLHKAAPLQELRSSEYAAVVLKRRFHVLPHDVLSMLKIGAVLGKEFELKLLCSLAQRPSKEVRLNLQHAEERHILWDTSDGKYLFVHDKLRETLLELLSVNERHQLHQSVAEKLMKEHPDRAFEIAYHFDAAGFPERAFPFAFVSAQTAREQYALEIAETQFRIAERGVARNDTRTMRMVAESLGDVLMLRGRYDEAAHYLTTARSLAKNRASSGNSLERATIEQKLGELHFKRGDVVQAARSLENALECLGYGVPKGRVRMFWALSMEVFWQLLHTLFPRFFLGRLPIEGAERERMRARIHSRLAYTYWFKSSRTSCLWTHLKGMNILERYPQSLELAQAYSEHAPVATLVGQFQRGMDYVLKSLDIRRKLHDTWGEGQSLNFYGVVLYCASSFKKTIESCTKGAEILMRTGDLWEVNTARWHVAYAHYRLGELRKAIELAQETYQAALRIGDLHASGISLCIWSKASGGRIPEPFIKDRLAQLDTDDLHTSSELLQAEGVRLLALGKLVEAEARFSQACELATSRGMYSEYTVTAFPWHVTSLRMQLDCLEAFEYEEKTRLLRKALGVSKQGLKLSKRFKNNLPHVLREHGLLLVYRNSKNSARKCLLQSLQIAEQQGARYERARTLIALARMKTELELGDPDFDLSHAHAELREIGANLKLYDVECESLASNSTTLSLWDRFESILEVGRRIATGTTRAELFQSVHKACLTLLRAETCTLLKKNGDNLEVLYGSYRNISRSLIEETESKKGPVVFLGEQSLGTSESIILSGIESALCIPIYSHGTAEMFAYLTHQKVQHLFGADEQRIAEFISTIAGAALENQSRTEALRENTQRLLQSNEELERYAFLASHDLQEPLRNLQLTSQLLEQELSGSVSADVKQMLSTISDNSQRMRSMVTDLLLYARLGTNRASFDTLDLNEALSLALKNLDHTTEEKGAHIFRSKLPAVVGNRTQIISVFQNLVGNSLKFCSLGSPVIEISHEIQDEFVRISVRDNGIGFDPKYSESIFQVFRRLQPSQYYPGTGIGLAACKKIVEQHGGKIWARSENNQGAEFMFTLPLAETKDDGVIN